MEETHCVGVEWEKTQGKVTGHRLGGEVGKYTSALQAGSHSKGKKS